MQIGLKIMIGFALVVAICAIPSVDGQLSCMDEKGQPVDWSMAYKFPKMKKSTEVKFKSGHAYAYFTSNDVKGGSEENIDNNQNKDDPHSQIFLYRFQELLYNLIGNVFKFRTSKRRQSPPVLDRKQSIKSALEQNPNWSVSDLLISDPKSIVMRTLAIAYDKKLGQSVSAIFYNDDPPAETPEDELKNNRRAHAKGVLLMNEKTGDGVWLTHSVPNFPPNREKELQFFDNSIRYGQTLMCISFDVHQSGSQLVKHLVNMRPLVYEHSISDALYKLIPELNDLSHEDDMKYKKIDVVPKLSQLITTKDGQVLHLFSKSINFNQDLYSGWIDTEVGGSLYAETWRKGAGGALESNCSAQDFHVNNVKDLKYDKEINWPYTKDHSKWAITDEQEKGVVCIADMNRMESQFKRGGGAVCMKCPTCWSVFSNTIKDVEPCPVPNVKKERAPDMSLVNRLKKIFAKG